MNDRYKDFGLPKKEVDLTWLLDTLKKNSLSAYQRVGRVAASVSNGETRIERELFVKINGENRFLLLQMVNLFDEKGQIIIDKDECVMDADDLMMIALDAGAEDFSDEEDSYEIVTAPDDLVDVADALSENKIAVVSSEVTMLPQTYVDVTD